MTDCLKRRLDKGLRYLQENPETICIVSGGKGRDEDISEAQCIFDQLTAMNLNHAPISEVAAIRHLRKHPMRYDKKTVSAPGIQARKSGNALGTITWAVFSKDWI